MFSKDKNVQSLLRHTQELGDLAAASAILSWDQETYMPPQGAEARAKQLATLAGVYHQKITSLPSSLFKAKTNNKYDLALTREVKRVYRKAILIPEKLVKEISETSSRAIESWKRAKRENKFVLFEKDLGKILALKIKAAKLLAGRNQSIYDVMLDEFEPGLTKKEVERVFEPLKSRLRDLQIKLTKITKNADKEIINKNYDLQKQWDFGLSIARDMGYDLTAGRQDRSAHPFTTTFSVHDVRITTRDNQTDPRPMLFSTIHETGHALYEQGVNPRLDRLQLGEIGGLGGGTGMAMHESQSRLWENIIGRSDWFWKKYYPHAQQALPALAGISRQEFVKAVNVVRPSLIRVEADEITYGLHIIIRFEMEKEMVGGNIKVKDLPKIWNAKYKELLGVEPENDREGVLQDIHWSMGAFGYFPTYFLGTLIAAQLWKKIPKTMSLSKIRNWLKTNIHRHGRIYSTQELLLKITGEPLNPQYFLDYLENKFNTLYNLK